MDKVVYILHLETATKSCSVALSKNGICIQKIEEHGDGFVHGEKLALFIKELLANCFINPIDLSAISISSGPGSYTGLRIGVSIAKGMCFALNIPLLSVNTLQSYERCVRGQFPHVKNVCVMIDARRMEVFSSIFNSEGISIKSTSADILDEKSYVQFEPFVCVGDGAPKMKESWMNRDIEFLENCNLSAEGQCALAFEKFNKQEFEDVAYFEPNYVKEFYTGN